MNLTTSTDGNPPTADRNPHDLVETVEVELQLALV